MAFTERFQAKFVKLLRWSETYTKTDMVYLASGGFWLSLEVVSAAVFSFVLAVVFGHYATKDLYGNYKYVLSVAGVIAAFSFSGIGTAITQSASRGKEGALKQGFSINLRWSAPMALLSLGIAAWYSLQGNSFVAISMCIVAISSPFLYSYSLFDNFLIGRREFSRSALYSMLGNFAAMAILIVALFLGGRAIALVVAYFAVNLGTAVFFYYRTLSTARNDQTDPEMFNYGFHLSVMGIIGAIADKIDSIAVFILLGPAHLATYTYAIAVPEQIKAIVKMITPISMPKFAQRSIVDIKKDIWSRMLILACALMLIVVVYVAAAPLLFRILFPVYIDSTIYSQIYAASVILTFITPIAAIFQAHKKTRQLYISTNVPALLLIVFLPLFTYIWGVAGAIAGVMIYRLITVIITCYLFLTLPE